MIHPDTELKFVGEPIGYGVFATAPIPEGTIVYVKDPLEIEISPEAYLNHPAELKCIIDKYSYIDQHGNRIISWDHGKYVNHCCNSNTISTGYGFEIAIRDIQKGEQITDEYGLFNIEEAMELTCGSDHCRMRITSEDFETYYQEWDKKVLKSLPLATHINQPLMAYVDEETQNDLQQFFADQTTYKSVYTLRYQPSIVNL